MAKPVVDSVGAVEESTLARWGPGEEGRELTRSESSAEGLIAGIAIIGNKWLGMEME